MVCFMGQTDAWQTIINNINHLKHVLGGRSSANGGRGARCVDLRFEQEFAVWGQPLQAHPTPLSDGGDVWVSRKPARPTPDTTVLAIQRRLNELGYSAGTPDGLFGNKTRSAIQTFQRDNGIAVTGTADQALLSRLKQAPQRSKIGSNESVGTSPQSLPSAPEVQLPRTLSGGKPSLSTATSWEQAAIENSCDYERRTQGPGEYYGCLRKELVALTRSGGRPDLSRASHSAQAAIESACDYERRTQGPGDYYSCLRKEMASLGYR